MADQLSNVLELGAWLARQGQTTAEHETLMRFVREHRPAGIRSFEEHLQAVCIAVERGGTKTLRELIALARESKADRELRFELVQWGLATLRDAKALAENAHRSFNEDDLLRLRDCINVKLHSLWPHAHDAKIAGAIGVATRLAGATLTVDWNHLFRAMQEPDMLTRLGD